MDSGSTSPPTPETYVHLCLPLKQAQGLLHVAQSGTYNVADGPTFAEEEAIRALRAAISSSTAPAQTEPSLATAEALERCRWLRDNPQPGLPVAPTPAPDEGAVEALNATLRRTWAAYFAQERTTGDIWDDMARAAIAWAHARYGATEAVLRGALEAAEDVLHEIAFTGLDVPAAMARDDLSEHYADAARSCIGRAARARPAAQAALRLTPSAAGEAVTTLVEAATEAAKALRYWGITAAAGALEKAAASFLPARGGGRR